MVVKVYSTIQIKFPISRDPPEGGTVSIPIREVLTMIVSNF